MAENEEKNMQLGWDSDLPAEVESERNLPPEGEYGFTVIEFEKTFSKAGKPMAKLNLQLDEEGQHWKVWDYLVLTESMAWKLVSFFECLGLKKKGEALAKMPWDKVLGASGRMTIKHETYNGNESCKVERYIVAEAAKAPTAPKTEIKAPDQGNLPFEV